VTLLGLKMEGFMEEARSKPEERAEFFTFKVECVRPKHSGGNNCQNVSIPSSPPPPKNEGGDFCLLHNC
jgi:hypothetical protein